MYYLLAAKPKLNFHFTLPARRRRQTLDVFPSHSGNKKSFLCRFPSQYSSEWQDDCEKRPKNYVSRANLVYLLVCYYLYQPKGTYNLTIDILTQRFKHGIFRIRRRNIYRCPARNDDFVSHKLWID
jgi:hypothetical protein